MQRQTSAANAQRKNLVPFMNVPLEIELLMAPICSPLKFIHLCRSKLILASLVWNCFGELILVWGSYNRNVVVAARAAKTQKLGI